MMVFDAHRTIAIALWEDLTTTPYAQTGPVNEHDLLVIGRGGGAKPTVLVDRSFSIESSLCTHHRSDRADPLNLKSSGSTAVVKDSL